MEYKKITKQILNKAKELNNCHSLQINDKVKTHSQKIGSDYQIINTYIYENKLYSEFELFLNGLCYYFRQIDNYNRFTIDINNIKGVL